jgi:RNA polymerase sigma factor (sigma-70 family)
VSEPRAIEHLLRELAPQVLGALARRHAASFDACEDAAQEALLAGAVQWPNEGVPENPCSWLIAVASRRLIDELRSEQARRRREEAVVPLPISACSSPPADEPSRHDDTLTLLFLCCHPALTPASQIALTLRAIGGLSTAQIASAFLVPEATMAQRISRSKQTIKASAVPFQLPAESDRPERLRAVLHVLYLVFNEGYTASSGSELQRLELADEAIRIARMLQRLLPGDTEVAGLLALMLLTHARRAARTAPDGSLVPLAEQDRGLWDAAAIEEGIALVSRALSHAPLGPYQLQAAIAAVHAEAARPEDTDWRQILGLYELLERLQPNPIVTLNRAVAVAMVSGPEAGLELLATIEGDSRLVDHHRFEAVRGHMLSLAGDHAGASASFQRAARLTTSLPERRYLESRGRLSRAMLTRRRTRA